MNRPLLDQDIHPLSEFRAKATSFVHQVHRTHRPVVVTHHGKSAAVLIDVADYEAMLDKMELIQDVRDGEQQIDRGEGLSHESAKRHVLLKLKA